jgi:hypothetical protein
MTQFTCKSVKQINNRISFKYDIYLYHSYLSAFFVSAGVPNGEFPEILIAKCRSRFYCTWFFSRVEDFESWRKGPSKLGENFFVEGEIVQEEKVINMTFTFTIRISRRFSSVREFQIGNFQKYWSQNVGQDFIVLDFFTGGRFWKLTEGTLKIGRTFFSWGEIVREEKVCAGD